jgi:uncharacterized protein YjdB
LITITDDVRVFTEIKGTIPITSGNDDDPPTIEIELTLTPQVEKESDAVIGVILNKTALALDIGGSETLVATVLPSNAVNKAVTWSSSDDAVAQVSQSGEVNAVAAGSATITVTTEEGEKTAICNVTVKEVVIGDIAVTGVTINKTSTSILISGTETLAATVLPSNATNQNVTWSSSADSIATVSQDGLITGKAEGIATITVKTEDGGFTANCAVSITSGITTVPVTDVTLDKNTLALKVGASETLTATVLPADATNKNVSWSSDKNAVATVTNGLVTAVSAGSATITVTTEDGNKTATCTVTVTSGSTTIPVTGVSLNKSTLSLDIGASETLTVTVLPADATNKNVSWSSNLSSIATVTNGLVTAVSAGSATITVTTQDGNKTATCTVTVSEAALTPEGLAAYLAKLSANSASTPYNIKLKVSNSYEFEIIKSALNGEPNKYVYLDLSVSSITTIPYFAFSGLEFNNGEYEYYGCATLTGITIPQGVTSIESVAFYLCTSLASVTIPNSVTSIGNFAFHYCSSLKSVTIPNSVTSIGENAFMACTSLTSIIIPDRVTSIEDGTFSKCTSLTSVSIPSSVTSIGRFAFSFCTSLPSITIPNSVTSIGNFAFHYCSSLKSVTIPNSVTSIGSGAFSECDNLASITIPNNVTSIGDSAFRNCSSLASINIPNGITSIGEWAFVNCTSLTSITIGSGVISIGNYAFDYCTSLASVTFAENSKVTSIGEAAFRSCTSLTNITIPNSVNSIGIRAFQNRTSLTSVTFQGTISSSEFSSTGTFPGDLRAKFYATDSSNGTPGRYTTTAPVVNSSVWTLDQ